MIPMSQADLARWRKGYRGGAPQGLPFEEALAPAKWTGRRRHEAGQEKGALLRDQIDALAQTDPDFAGAACEVAFHPTRKWRLDVAIARLKIGVEIHGGVFIRGGHSRGAQQVKDWEKANAAQIRGWIVLAVLPEWIKKGIALDLVAQAVHARRQRASKEEA